MAMDFNDGAAVTVGFHEKWTSGIPGMKKQAKYAIDSYVRYKMRENGIVRSPLLPPLTVTPAQLDRSEDPSVLRKFMELEPNSSGTSVPFRGQPRRKFVRGGLVPVYFKKIESEEHVVNLVDLANYTTDLRKILDEQDVKEMQTQEDEGFLGEVLQICIDNTPEQYFNLYGGMNKNNWVSAQQSFPVDRPIKYALMNTITYKEFYKWNLVDDMGYGPYGADVFSKGTLPTINGIQIIQTIKRDLVPDGRVHFFAPEDYIGKFYEYQEPTTFVKQEKDWLYISSYEIVGIGIGNTKSFITADFHA